jgi:phospholipase C
MLIISRVGNKSLIIAIIREKLTGLCNMKKTLSIICMLTTLFFILISGLLASTMYIANALSLQPNTPIEHIVILFQENISFDHYFATYPNARNLPGEPNFSSSPNTPSVNGLNSTLLSQNPNSANPVRLDRSHIITCDMNHSYTAEQKAYNRGSVDKFVEFTGSNASGCDPKQVMGYFDGNTVTALWNYAQHYAMSDNFFATTYGPSVLGHINLVSGNTHGAIIVNPKPPNETSTSDRIVNGTIIANKDPAFDDCSEPKYSVISMEGRNIGDLLNAANITWGWFSAGFVPSIKTADDNKWHCSFTGLLRADNRTQQHDYYPDVEPFQYYRNTSNPHHLAPSSISAIGQTDQANHQYDMSYFWSAAESGNLPAVSFLKAPSYQSAHAGFSSSNPSDEQTYLVNTINRLQKIPQWNNTAIIITYDDSDGWYDHVMPPIVGGSKDLKFDSLSGVGQCGNTTISNGPFQDRCGYGPRLPFLIISPWAKVNFVDHTLTDQTSIMRFIEDNWSLGRIGNNSYDSKAGSILNMLDFNIGHKRANNLFLDPSSGTSILITK